MEFATGALGSLLPKLSQLLKDEYNLHKDSKKDIEFLTRELETVHAALRSVGEVPLEEVSDLLKVWARDVRELSYNMEDIVDTFLVRVQGPAAPSKRSAKRFIKEMMGFVSKAMTQHDIGQEIKHIKERVEEVARRRDRYKVDAITPVKIIDPRIASLYTKAADLVGIDDSRDGLITRLTKGDERSLQKQRIVSVVGFGGLGKTTLAKVVYDRLKGQFSCTAFVPVGRNPNLKKVLMDILIGLHKQYMDPKFAIFHEMQLITELREFMENKRYFIVIDDVWETRSWEIMKLALVENNSGSRIIITTRNQEVAKEANEVYKLQQLSDDNARKLFFGRISCGKSIFSNHQVDDEVSNKILKKCDGIPLAIITMASLLVGKHKEEWSEVHRSIGFGNKENQQVENTMKILSFSYYDLPSHLRTCLLYLSVFPEDYFIEKNTLLSMWTAEGFVREKQGMSTFEIGEGYFNELVNRSMIQLVEMEDWDRICGCQVHDMVLDLIRSISFEENFVTILDKNEGALSSSQGKVRRLALQDNSTVKAHMDMQLLRSFISWWSDIDKGISLSSFKLVRVLALHTTSYSYSYCSNQCYLPLRNLLHLRYLQLSVASVMLPAEVMGSLKFLQTLDVGESGNAMMDQVMITDVGLLKKLLFLRFRGPVSIVPDGIGKLTSLEELRLCIRFAHWRQFVKELCGLGELRVLRLDIADNWLMDVREVDGNMVLQFLRNLQKLKILLLTTSLSPVHADTTVWEAAGFLLSRHLQRLSLSWIRFSRFPSFCISPLRLPHLSHLFLCVDDMDEEDLRILGGLPQLCFLELDVHAIAEVNCNTRTDDDGFLFQNLRRCSIWYKGVRLLLPSGPSQEDYNSISFCMRNVHASMLLGSETEDTVYKAAAVRPTPMPRFQELWFTVYVHEFINHNDDCVSLALEYFASLHTVRVYICCDNDSSAAEVEQVKEALRRAVAVHPNRPILEVT